MQRKYPYLVHPDLSLQLRAVTIVVAVAWYGIGSAPARAQCSEPSQSTVEQSEATQCEEVKQYLRRVGARAKRTLRVVPASAVVSIHNSGLVLAVTPLLNSQQIPIQAASSELPYLTSVRLCKMYEGIWMSTPYGRLPDPLGTTALIRISLADDNSRSVTANVVRIDSVDKLKLNGVSYVQTLPAMVRDRDIKGIANYLIFEDHPEDLAFVVVKNIWMHIAGVASGPPRRAVNLGVVIDCLPNWSVDRDSLKLKVAPFEDRLNRELSNDLHRANLSGIAPRLSAPLGEMIAELLATVIDEIKSTKIDPQH